jgi:hypothetical protein
VSAENRDTAWTRAFRGGGPSSQSSVHSPAQHDLSPWPSVLVYLILTRVLSWVTLPARTEQRVVAAPART